MQLDELDARFAAGGGALLAHQRRALESDAEVVILAGDSATGKSFTALPWMLSRDGKGNHALLVTSMRTAEVSTLTYATKWLDSLGIEFVYGRRPPVAWQQGGVLARTTYRDVLTIRGGASVQVLTLSGRQWRGLQWSSIFVNAAERYGIDQDAVACAVLRSTRAIVTTYDGTGQALTLRRLGVDREAEIVQAATANPHVDLSRMLRGVRTKAEAV